MEGGGVLIGMSMGRGKDRDAHKDYCGDVEGCLWG